jgi:hypothetical protein
MAEVFSNSTIEFRVHLQLSESESRALYALTRYGLKAFLEVFYKHLGKIDLEPEEKGLIDLFQTIGKQMPKHIARFDATRNTFKNSNPNL